MWEERECGSGFIKTRSNHAVRSSDKVVFEFFLPAKKSMTVERRVHLLLVVLYVLRANSDKEKV